MAKLTRVTGKVFGGSAPLDEIGQFGSALAGDPTNTQDVATIQALNAYSEGWGSAVISSLNFPPIEEVTGVLKTISYQGCYLLQEGIPEYDAGTNYSNTSIVKSVNGDELIFYVSKVNDNLGNPLNDTDYWARAILDGRASFLGQIVPSTLPLVDAGLHLLDGALLQYGSYKAFIDYIANLYSSNPSASYFCTEAQWQQSVTTYGVCGKFVYDSVNNTVRLPKITGFTEGTITPSTVGNLTQAGLPNITGEVGYLGVNTVTLANGAFTTSRATSLGHLISDSGTDPYKANFNASRSSSIYGNSSTVQPQSIKVLYYIVVANTTKTQIQVDIDEVATDLNGKADVDLTNVNNTGTSTGASWAMPSDTYEDLTFGSAGAAYTAPANGWFFVEKTAGFAGAYVSLLNLNTKIHFINHVPGASNICTAYISALKGEVVQLDYNATGSTNYFRFIYAKGSESEAS